MINKKISLLFISPFVLATPLLLASCATTSQYGVAATITYKVNSTGAGTTIKEGNSGNSSSNSFDGYAYDWTNSKLYKDKKVVGQDENKEFNLLLSMGIVPEVTLFSRLITGSHIGFTSSETDNPLFGMYSENSNNTLLKEFMYASSNILNQGRSGEIRLSISNVDITASSSFLPTDSDTLKVIDVAKKSTTTESNNEYKVSNVQFQNSSILTFNFTMKYFSSGNSDPFKTNETVDKVNSYLNSKGDLWGGQKATVDSFSLSSKLEVNINPIYSINSDFTLDYDLTNGVKNTGNAGSSTQTSTKEALPKNDVTFSTVKDHLTLIGATVQYSYKNGTSSTENGFAKALSESLKESTSSDGSGDSGSDNTPKVEKRKTDNSGTLSTWLLKANEFTTVTTNQDIQNYRNTLSSGFKKTIILNASTNNGSSK